MAGQEAELDALVHSIKLRAPQDAAALLATRPQAQAKAALRALPSDLAARIEAYLDQSVQTSPVPGAVRELLEPARGVFAAATSVSDAIDWLRAANAPQDITYLYVTGMNQRLLGLIVLRDLLLAAPDAPLDSLMLREPFRLTPEQTLGDAVKAAVKRHYPVYPVCDVDGRLVGQVRGWKLFEQQALELTAQSGRMVGINKEERIDTGFWIAFKLRHPWLQINLLTAFLAAFVVGSFEDTIARIVALAAFLPLLAGQSGNTGCQALAITLRGMTLGDFERMSVQRMLAKEALLGTLNGFLTGLVAATAMWLTVGGPSGDPQALMLALVIVMAMTGACLASGIFGVLVPLVLRRCGADPAMASSIFLTTGTDIAGMGLMLFLASSLVL